MAERFCTSLPSSGLKDICASNIKRQTKIQIISKVNYETFPYTLYNMHKITFLAETGLTVTGALYTECFRDLWELVETSLHFYLFF